MLAPYELHLFPLSVEGPAVLAQVELEERHALECVQVSYDGGKERVEEDWRTGRRVLGSG